MARRAPRGTTAAHRLAMNRSGPVVITGGAGFVGSNLADRLIAAGEPVVLVDSLARPHALANSAWLRRRHGTRARLLLGDVRDPDLLARALRGAGAVYHLAVQRGGQDPAAELDVNA